jgi:hypothetical protein
MRPCVPAAAVQQPANEQLASPEKQAGSMARRETSRRATRLFCSDPKQLISA